MKITSPAFKEGEEIPSIYTADGRDWNPPLEFTDIPEEAKSLVLIMEDYDVPKDLKPDGLWVHWVMYDIPPNTKGIGEHAHPPGVHGKGTNGRTAYMGPAPPDRRHNYHFHLYALDIAPDWPKGMERDEVLKKMEGHIIKKTTLTTNYELKGSKG